MHLILSFCMVLRTQTSKILNQGTWLMKLLFIIIISLLFIFALPPSWLHFFHQITRYLSILWFIIQNIILIDFFYNIDIFFTQTTEAHPKMHIFKAILSFVVIGLAIYLNVMTYMCKVDSYTFIPIIGSILIIIGFIIVFLRVFKGNTLMVFGLIMSYLNYQAYQIMTKAQQQQQQQQSSSSFNTIFHITLIFFSLFLVLAPGSYKIRTKKSTLNQILALNTSKQQQDTRYVSSNKWIIFHYIFFVICLVLPAVIQMNTTIYNDYQQQQSSDGNGNLFQTYRVINWFIILLVYLWTLIVVRLYPQQDFSQLESYFKQYELN